MLKLKVFQPASDKVRQAEFHPVQPWVVSATKSNHVCVWDWSTQQVLHEIQLGVVEGDLLQDTDAARMHLRDPSFAPNPSALASQANSLGRGGAGAVRDVRFLDLDVAQAQLTQQHLLVNGSSSPPPSADSITTLHGRRLLVLVCENKVLLYDLLTRKTSEISKNVLESKVPTCVAFLLQGGAIAPSRGSFVMASPILAIGCADGIVRLVWLSSLQMMSKLTSPHKSPISQLISHAVRGQPWEGLIAGHQHGSLARWEPLMSNPSAAGVAAKADAKVHDKEVVGMVLAAVTEGAENLHRMLFTIGLDNRLQGLDSASLTSASDAPKVKLEPKSPATCLAYTPRGFVSAGAVAGGVNTLLVGTEAGLIFSISPVSGLLRIVASLGDFLPGGKKKAPKIYGLCVHPSSPEYVLAATNVGTALLVIEALTAPAICPLPLRAPSHALPPPEGSVVFGEAAGAGATYVVVVGGSIDCVTASTLQQNVAAAHANGPVVQVLGTSRVSKGGPGGKAIVSSSFDGSYISVVWAADRSYSIYRQGVDSWTEVGKGWGSSIAWHATSPRFAVVQSAESLAAATTPKKETVRKSILGFGGRAKVDKAKGKGKDGGVEEDEAKDAAAVPKAAEGGGAGVQIREAQGSTLRTVHQQLRLGGGSAVAASSETPVFVESGPLLGVTLRRQMPNSDLRSGPSPADVLQFYDWDNGAKVGAEMPEPAILAWDPSLRFAALAYSSQIVVCRVQPTFAPFATLPVHNATCLEWAARQLYILTPTHIYCAFVSTSSPSSSGTTTHLITLASFAPTPATAPLFAGVDSKVPQASASQSQLGSLLSPATAKVTALQPPPMQRLPGPLVLLGPRDGYLWVVNAHGQPIALPLTHPGYTCCSLVASGDLVGARYLASTALSPALHDEFALFVWDMDGSRGSGLALALPGLSLTTDARLSLATKQWQRAFEACEALLEGHTHRPLPSPASTPASTAAFAHTSTRAGTGGGSSYQPSYPAAAFSDSTFMEPSAQNSPGAGGSASGAVFTAASPPVPAEELDWAQPLRQAGAAAGGRGPADAAAAALLRPRPPAAPRHAVELTLVLLRELLGIGMHDVGKHVARLLACHSGSLDGSQLSALAGCMSEAGMKPELPQLAHGLVPGASGLSYESAGLLAALLSGHTGIVNDVLTQSGSPALAALHAASYKLTGAPAAASAWRQQLAGMAGPSRGVAHFTVSA